MIHLVVARIAYGIEQATNRRFPFLSIPFPLSSFMDQPTAIRTLFKLGGEAVTPTSHVIVYSKASTSSHQAGELLVNALAQLNSHRIQLVPENVFCTARATHSEPGNDGSSCRVPIVVGRCAQLEKLFQWEQSPVIADSAASSSSNGLDWQIRTHPIETTTFMPAIGATETKTELALQFHVPNTDNAHADDPIMARNLRASILWFAKEVLACDITKLTSAESTAATTSSSSADEPHIHRVLSPLPNAQLNVDRLFISYSFPIDLRHNANLDLIRHTSQLEFLINGENSVIEMDLPKIDSTSSAASAGVGLPPVAPSSSSSTSTAIDLLSTPSPSPPIAMSSVADHESPVIAKHTPLQPLPHGTSVPRHHGRPMIAVDLDEVLGEFIPPLAQFHNATYGSSLRPEDFHSYHFASVWGGTNEEAQDKVHAFFKSKYFKDIPVIEGAFDVLTGLKDRFDFTVVTSRQHMIEGITREWLAKHYPNVFTSVLFGNHYGLAGSGRVSSKPDMCLSIHAVALIDDSITYARQCSNVVEKVLLFDRDNRYTWNRNTGDVLPTNVTRCTSWDAMREQLEDWQPGTGDLIRISAEPE